MASGVVPVSDRGDTREHGDALNRVVFRDNGSESATVLWTNSAAPYILTVLNTDAAGDAVAVLLPATAATGTPSAANSAVLLNATGVSVGGGKELRLYDATGAASYANLYRSAADVLKTDDSLLVAADLTVSGNASVTGTLGVTGATTLSGGGALSGTFSGNVTLSGGIALTAAGLALSVTNNATIGGTLGVTGTLTASNALNVGGLLSANGGQVGFPATQNASAGANTLDDYQEGSWTPSIGGTATYTGRDGWYVKIGHTVFFGGFLTVNAIGVGASASTISGLPEGGTDFNDDSASATKWSSLAASPVFLSFRITGSTLVADGLTAAGGSSGVLNIFGAAASVHFSGHYRTAS